MPAEIILQARKENEVVIEGEVHLVINEDTPSDIVIEVPNQNGRLLSKEMLSNNTLVSSDTIKRPIILVPENNSIGFTGTFVLSPYEPSETYSGVPTGMRIEISATEDFSVIMKNVVIDELLTEVPVTFEESSQVLYARVKYVSDSHVSGYSDVVKFTNSDFYVYQPKILTPTMSATGVARTPFIQVSDYQYMGNENYYAGLTYEVATDVNFTNIVETDTVGSPNTGGSGASNGEYLNNFIVNTILDEDTVYYIRVKYLGTIYPSSVWSDVISFRTFNIEEKIINILNTGSTYGSTRTFYNNGRIYTIITHQLSWYLLVYNDKLELLYTKKIIVNNSGSNFKMTFLADGSPILVYSIINSVIDEDIFIIKFTSAMEIVKSIKIKNTGGTSALLRMQDIIADNNNIYIAGLGTTLSNSTLPYIIKLDYNLSLVAKKTIKLTGGNIHYDCGVFYGITIFNNTLVLTGFIGYNTGVTYNLYDCLLVKMDLNLNILAKKTFLLNNYTPRYSATENIVYLPSIDKFMVTGYLSYQTSGNVGGFILLMDSNFTIIKSKIFYDSLSTTMNSFRIFNQSSNINGKTRLFATATNNLVLDVDDNLNYVKYNTGKMQMATFDSNIIDDFILSAYGYSDTTFEYGLTLISTTTTLTDVIYKGNVINTVDATVVINGTELVTSYAMTAVDFGLSITNETINISDTTLTPTITLL